MNDQIENRIAEVLKGTREFDNSVRECMERALKVQESKDALKQMTDASNPDAQRHTGHLAISHLAIDVAITMANAFAALRRPSEARSYRIQLDMIVGLNQNQFWGQHAPSLLPLWHMFLIDHLDSLSMQIERGDIKISPWDKLIMGAEASALAPFSQILFLVGGLPMQMAGAVQLKKELMPLLMK